MEKRKIFFLILILNLSILYVQAQSFVEMKQTYPVSMDNGRRVITGFQPFSCSDDVIFSNTMKWVINDFCKEKRDEMFDIFVNKKSFSFNMTLEYSANGKVKYVFFCKANIKVVEGKLVYTLYDIQYKSSSIISFSQVISLDKLTPEKKEKHKEVILAFQELASAKLNQMFDAVIENQCAAITHWSDINIQRPVKGMNEDECLLAFGKPTNNYEDNHNRIQWSYGLNFILIFKEGKLETIIK